MSEAVFVEGLTKTYDGKTKIAAITCNNDGCRTKVISM